VTTIARAGSSAGAQIINVSLGSRRDDPRLRQAVILAEKHGCLVVASAGDSGRPEYPAVLLLLVGLFVLACAVGVLLALRTRGNRKRWPPRRPATYVPGSWDQSW